MRFNTFRFLVREGFRGMGKNWFMSAASVLVLVSCLLITGCAYLVLENIEHGFDWAYQQNVVVVYADKGLESEKLTAIEKEITGMDNIVEVEFQSKEDLLSRYEDQLGSLLEDLEEDNPLQDAFVVHFEDLSLFNQTVKKIAKLEGVESVSYNEELSATLVQARTLVLTIGGWVIALLLLVSLFIIANTIKLTVYSRRLEIFIMRSVGATQWFIRFPFMVEGVVLGCLAGALAYGLVFGLYQTIGSMFDFGAMFQLIPFASVWWRLLLGFLSGGTLTGLLGSGISMSRYLKEQTE